MNIAAQAPAGKTKGKKPPKNKKALAAAKEVPENWVPGKIANIEKKKKNTPVVLLTVVLDSMDVKRNVKPELLRSPCSSNPCLTPSIQTQ